MRKLPIILALAFLPLFPGGAFAHAIGVSCKIQGKRVEVEAYFDDDSPAALAKISVINASGSTILEGKADEDGNWSFATPAPGNYEVRVDAGAGHRAKKTLIVPAVKTAAHAPVSDGKSESVDGTSRADFTRIPWLNIGIGLIIIVSLSCVYLVVSVLRSANRPRSGTEIG